MADIIELFKFIRNSEPPSPKSQMLQISQTEEIADIAELFK